MFWFICGHGCERIQRHGTRQVPLQVGSLEGVSQGAVLSPPQVKLLGRVSQGAVLSPGIPVIDPLTPAEVEGCARVQWLHDTVFLGGFTGLRERWFTRISREINFIYRSKTAIRLSRG